MKYISVFAFVLFICSCSKDSDSIFKPNVTIFDAGQPSTGCGWIVQIDSVTEYHPDNLSPTFQTNNLKVDITYKLTKDTFTCGDFVLVRIPIIHILSIKKK